MYWTKQQVLNYNHIRRSQYFKEQSQNNINELLGNNQLRLLKYYELNNTL